METEGWRQGKEQRGCRGRKRTRGRGGVDPGHETGRETARDSGTQRERQGETPREGETDSERTEMGGVGGTETGAGGNRERKEGQGVEGPERRRGTGTDRNKKRSLRPGSQRRLGPRTGVAWAVPQKAAFLKPASKPTRFGPLDPDHSCPPAWDIDAEAEEEGRDPVGSASPDTHPSPALAMALTWALVGPADPTREVFFRKDLLVCLDGVIGKG